MTTMISDPSPKVRGTVPAPAVRRDNRALCGREAERLVIRDLLRRARRGTGGAVLVEGEQGIGKSLLLREAVEEAAQYGFSLAVGTADPLGQLVPFFAFRRALGESFAKVIDDLPDDELHAVADRWIGQIRAHLEQRAATAPVVVCLDNLHRASPATLAALRTLPRELKHHPIAWVLARCTSAGPAGQDAEHLFKLIEEDGAARLTLAPLAKDEVSALLTDAFGAPPGGDLRALAAGAAGNPWLLTELVGGLREDEAVRIADGEATMVSDRLPERLRRVARQRLAGVSEKAERLLTTSAILGQSFRLEDAAEMLAVPPAVLLSAVQETMRAGITTAVEDRFSFRHELLRRAVADTIPPPGRNALHRQYGQILLSRGESPVLAASHLMRAAAPENPASLADLDSVVAQTLSSAPQTAADLASHVLDMTSPGDPGELPRMVAAAEALAAAGRIDKGLKIVRRALAKPLPPLAEARLRCALSSFLRAGGQAREAIGEAKLALAQGDLPDSVRDQAMTAHLQALAGAGDELAISQAATVLAAPERYESHVVVAALVARGFVAWDKGQVSEALGLLRDAARRETAVSPDARHAQPLLALAAVLIDLRQLAEAEALIDAADNRALRATPNQAAAAILRARLHLAGGSIADAAAAGQRALAIADALGADCYVSTARCVLAAIALRVGDATSAAQHVAGGPVRGLGYASRYARAEVLLAQARVSEARDGVAAARCQVRRVCAELPGQRGGLLGDPAAAAWLARAALAVGDRELAEAVAQAAADLAAANPGYPAITAAATHSLGVVGKEPDRLAAAAADHLDPWARASAAEDLGVLHSGQVGPDKAISCFTEAIHAYQLAGAAMDTARVRRRLRELGVRRRHWAQPARRPATGWESLTDAERTVSELVAQGLNNRQIANRMYVSAHTVAFYMRQIFRKLTIGSRVELACLVTERGPADARADYRTETFPGMANE